MTSPATHPHSPNSVRVGTRYHAATQAADLVVSLCRSVRAALRGNDDTEALFESLGAASIGLARWLATEDFDPPAPGLAPRNTDAIKAAWVLVEVAEDVADLVRRRRMDPVHGRAAPAWVAWLDLHGRIGQLRAAVEAARAANLSVAAK